MKINNSKKTKTNKILFIIASVLVGLALIFMALEITGVTHLFSSPDTQNTDQIKEAETNSSNKQDLIDGKSDNRNTGDTIPEPTVDDISLSTQRETDGSVTIFNELRNYSDGTCDLTISNGNNTYTQTAPVLYQDEFSSCIGFNVPVAKLGAGTWQISLTVTSKGKANTKTTSVEVQ